jgi:teichuronic acid biosynthesis glycosyltransferase TuaG
MSEARPPRVAVIMPAHNAEEYLGEALESLLAQRYPDWEVVVADDASTDGTLALAESFAARHPDRIKVVALERNSGPALARNVAVRASSGGKLLALLDADDWWRDDYLEHQVGNYDAAVAAGRRVGICACNALIQRPEGLTGETFAESFWWRDSIDYDSLLERPYVFVSALFPRKAFDEVGGFSPECWGSEDRDLWLRIMEAGYEVVTTREPVAVYRLSPEGISRNQLTMADAALAAHGRVLRRGVLTPSQQRLVKSRIRHFLAIRDRALFMRAVAERRPLGVLLHGMRAAPRGLIAFLQEPSRWGEWARDGLRIGRRARRWLRPGRPE